MRRAWPLILLVFVAAAPANRPASMYETVVAPQPLSKIDALVLDRLKELGIRPANICTDGVFVRRVYLDVIGTLPTVAEARAFLSDTSPNRRAVLIDKLLERDEFADFWAMKWADLLRVKSEFPINLWPNAVQAYHRWIRTAVRIEEPRVECRLDIVPVGVLNLHFEIDDHAADPV